MGSEVLQMQETSHLEEEALVAIKRALPDTMAQTIVIQRYATVDECTQHLAELEALQEEKCSTLPAASPSSPGDQPARARAGRVRQVAAAADGQEQEAAEQDSPMEGPATSGRERRASSSGSETSERSLREEIQEGFRDLGRDLRSLTIRVERAGNWSPGRFRG